MSEESAKGEAAGPVGDAKGAAPVPEPREGGTGEKLPAPCIEIATFRNFFPRLASEKRFFFEAGDGQAYEIVEFYCPKPGCECRNVTFGVMRKGENAVLALLNSIVPDSEGTMPKFDYLNKIETEPPGVLESVRALFASDPAIVETIRLRRQLMRDAVAGVSLWIDGQHPDEEDDEDGEDFMEEDDLLAEEPRPQPRNAPCRCGSGKKYKHCCGRAGKARS